MLITLDFAQSKHLILDIGKINLIGLKRKVQYFCICAASGHALTHKHQLSMVKLLNRIRQTYLCFNIDTTAILSLFLIGRLII